ncbi:MAG: hypothetical protein COT74_14305 [Bdellovibrionales bacterium CG10_big_fil_rev_8_21_14_0_10_45_34]|nr:MAG: hypothetical protein COT74_14305 [Bdellovibrionales bacterium CG10_big_fil_rev_8_21_14_0_10_45_34]
MKNLFFCFIFSGIFGAQAAMATQALALDYKIKVMGKDYHYKNVVNGDRRNLDEVMVELHLGSESLDTKSLVDVKQELTAKLSDFIKSSLNDSNSSGEPTQIRIRFDIVSPDANWNSEVTVKDRVNLGGIPYETRRYDNADYHGRRVTTINEEVSKIQSQLLKEWAFESASSDSGATVFFQNIISKKNVRINGTSENKATSINGQNGTSQFSLEYRRLRQNGVGAQ